MDVETSVGSFKSTRRQDNPSQISIAAVYQELRFWGSKARHPELMGCLSICKIDSETRNIVPKRCFLKYFAKGATPEQDRRYEKGQGQLRRLIQCPWKRIWSSKIARNPSKLFSKKNFTKITKNSRFARVKDSKYSYRCTVQVWLIENQRDWAEKQNCRQNSETVFCKPKKKELK